MCNRIKGIKSGIYQIRNLVNGNIYIGSCINLKERKTNHLWYLRNNKHSNIHLQNAWNKYGDKNFKFEIIEYVEDINKLIEREQYWIDSFKNFNKIIYNMRIVVESQRGIKRRLESNIKSSETMKGIANTWRGKHHTKESKNKISKAHEGDNHWTHKKPITKEQEIKLSKSLPHGVGELNGKSKLKKEDVIKIKKLLYKNIKLKEIADIFNIHYTTISLIKTGKTWRHIEIKDE